MESATTGSRHLSSSTSPDRDRNKADPRRLGAKGDRRQNIFMSELRIFGQKLGLGHPFGEEIEVQRQPRSASP
jgi:hypothetical protein